MLSGSPVKAFHHAWPHLFSDCSTGCKAQAHIGFNNAGLIQTPNSLYCNTPAQI